MSADIPLLDEIAQGDLIKKYDVPSPRYTSYPPADQFREDAASDKYMQYLEQRSTSTGPLSLYVHIPFCRSICYYCACNKIVTRNTQAAGRYLDSLEKEVALKAPLFSGRRAVNQLHLGGGTPTFLSCAELVRLMHLLARHFDLIDDESREYAIEVDPRTVSPETLALLVGLGFNRISMGIQDFDSQVQAAINRKQDYAMVAELVASVKDFGFKSLNFDLIYGLPLQSLATISETLAKTITLAPDRISVYNYAHLPERFSSQRQMDRYSLPDAETKLDMSQLINETLLAAGYVSIGMDHYAKADDDLAKALVDGSLQRNFQGYSTTLSAETIGFGVSAITSHAKAYMQNVRELDSYETLLDQGRLPVNRYLGLTKEDCLRRYIITTLACQLKLDFALIEKRYGVVFVEHFKLELPRLEKMQTEGLLALSAKALVLTTLGRQLIRNICQVFDQYHDGSQSRYSRAI